jgi:hypothetical protein
LGIGKTRLFALLKAYHHNPNEFSIRYARHTKTRKIPQDVESNILRELHMEKHLKQDKDVSLR